MRPCKNFRDSGYADHFKNQETLQEPRTAKAAAAAIDAAAGEDGLRQRVGFGVSQ